MASEPYCRGCESSVRGNASQALTVEQHLGARWPTGDPQRSGLGPLDHGEIQTNLLILPNVYHPLGGGYEALFLNANLVLFRMEIDEQPTVSSFTAVPFSVQENTGSILSGRDSQGTQGTMGPKEGRQIGPLSTVKQDGSFAAPGAQRELVFSLPKIIQRGSLGPDLFQRLPVQARVLYRLAAVQASFPA